MTDYKQLCAELVAAWDDLPWQYDWKGNLTGIDGYPPDDSAVERARTALAEPEPAGPTVMEIIELADEIEKAELGQVDLVRAALARWGK